MVRFERLREEDEEDPEMAPLKGPAVGYGSSSSEERDDVKTNAAKTRKRKHILALMRPERGRMALGTFFLLLSSASTVLIPHFLGGIVDGAVMSDRSSINRAALIVFGLALFGAVCSFFRSWIFTLSGHRIVARLRRRVFEAILRQDISWFDQEKTGELTSRLSSDCSAVQNALTVNLSMAFRNVVQIFGYLVFLFTISWKLTLTILVAVPILSTAIVFYTKYVKRIQKKFQDDLGEANSRAEEVFSAIRTVRAFTTEDKERQQFNRHIDSTLDSGRKQSLAEGGFQALFSLVTMGLVSIVLYFGGWLVAKAMKHPDEGGHGLSLGQLVSFLFYTMQMTASIGMLGGLFQDFAKAAGATERIFSIMERVPTIPVKCEKSEGPSPPVHGKLEFHNVHFAYPTRAQFPVLRGCSVTANPGEMCAFVGPSGGGKSTIINLCLRFYDPDSGNIKLDGILINSMDPKKYRKYLSIVSQEPTLFSCSIADNIKYGFQEGSGAVDMNKIVECAKMANAHDFIESFPDGYDTLVGERGVQLSGGQKQRIAIARALLKSPKVLLLDEATSALDSESEAVVQEALDRAAQGRTSLVIAHRLSTIASASKIAVVSNGVISESGSHQNLIAAGGLYTKLVRKQTLESSESDNE